MSTLYINVSDSRCGACGKNADPNENAHLNERMAGEGCGAVYTGLASHYAGFERHLMEMRPDLPWVGMAPIEELRK